MRTYDGVSVPVRHVPPDEADLSQIIGGRRSWYQEREPEPLPSDQTTPGRPQIRPADLQAWIEKRMAEIKRRPLLERIAATLESE